MSIPIENLYYLLCYSWNKLEEKEKVNISTDGITELVDLFAKILINSTRILMKRGIEKNYIDYHEEIAGIKGKMDFAQTVKSNLLVKQKTICQFDDFSANILSNQVLLTTISVLIKTNHLDKDLKNELIRLGRMFINIDHVKLSSAIFDKIKFHRNNRIYQFIINVCRIIYDSIVPSEKTGRYSFKDFYRDPTKMNVLFESFIRNFYRIEQQEYPIVKKEIIKWKFEELETGKANYLPQMETDISLINNERKIIIDAKYYSVTMTNNYDTQKIHSANLYQLFSYLLNQENDDKRSLNATGILLYPVVDEEYDLCYQYEGHKVMIKTLNLNQNWKKIDQRLREIICV